MEENIMDKISVIVPCYNEEESIFHFYEETARVLDQMRDVDYELLFVDDGSKDKTIDMLRKLCDKDARCRYLSFSRNFGKEAAMYAGLSEATGNYCVIMDADLQHPPKLLPQMYQAVSKEGFDCCGGKRIGREGDGFLRSFCSRLFYKVGKSLTHMDMGDGYGDFRMMNRTMVDAILSVREYNRYMKGIFSFVGFHTKWIPFENVERENGTSKWNLRSLLSYAMEGIFAFSTAPLKLAGVVGALLLFVGMVFLLVNLIQQIFLPGALSQFDVLLVAILVLSGVQMIFLYIVGIYLSKDCMENRNRPVYIVRERG
jgi:glycosyltransferase involved in cell wall biosynthesis